jgi:DNA-binding response OmpR family regulator
VIRLEGRYREAAQARRLLLRERRFGADARDIRPRSTAVNAREDAHENAMPRVVLISTSGLVRFRLRRELTPRGFVVVDVDNIGDTTRAVANANADVVLIDASSGTPTGRHLVKALKHDPKLRRTPVLFLDDSAPSEETRQSVLAAGADGIVPRGDDFDALAATLSLHMRR